MSTEKKNGAPTAVAAKTGATAPKIEVKTEVKLQETANPKAETLQNQPLPYEQRVKQIPIINSMVEKIGKLERNAETIRQIKAKRTGDNEKFVFHFGQSTLEINNPLWVDKILDMMGEAFAAKVVEAKQDFERLQF